MKARGLREVLLFVGSALAYIWAIEPTGDPRLKGPALAAIVAIPFVSVLLHRDTPRALGLRLDNLAASAREVGAFALLTGAGIVGLGLALGATPRWPDASQLFKVYIYPLWALLQQFALQSFAPRRMRETVPSPTAATAALFAAAHVPNVPLVLATLVGGFAFCTLFARRPNLYTLALCHALLAALILAMWPTSELRNLRIGPSYWR